MAGNCPNCGAPIDGIECGYCGTTFVDFAIMDVKKPFYMRLRFPEGDFTAKVVTNGFTLGCCRGEMPVINAEFYVVDFVGA